MKTKNYFNYGKLEGKGFAFFDNGALRSYQNYRNGCLEGRCYTYNKYGKLESIDEYNGEKFKKTLY